MVVLVPTLILLFGALYRRTPGVERPSLGGGRRAAGMAPVPAAVLVVVLFGGLKARASGAQ